MVSSNVDIRVEALDSVSSTDTLALAHMDSLEQELSVEVTHVYRVQVYHVQVGEARQNQVL